MGLDAQSVADAFGLGRAASLSEPVARGELGQVRRLVTDQGAWAVKESFEPFDAEELAAAQVSGRFHVACWVAGIPTPAPQSSDGQFVVEVAGEQVQAYANDHSIGLTPREFEVLYALARNAGKPMPRSRLYREVWGYEMLAGDRSVDVFVRKVRQKLARALPDHPYIQTHYGVGYRFELVPGENANTTAIDDLQEQDAP